MHDVCNFCQQDCLLTYGRPPAKHAFSWVTSDDVTMMAVTPFSHIRKPHAVRKLHSSIFYRTRVIADQSFTLREERISPFCAPVILTLSRWPTYMNLTCIPSRCICRPNINFLSQAFRKLSHYRQTDILCKQMPPTSRRVILNCVRRIHT